MKEFDFLKYLQRNPSKEIENIDQNFDGFFRIGVIIPVLSELEYLEKTLRSLAVAQKKFPEPVLILLVINHGENTQAQYIQDNQKLLAQLRNNSAEFHCSNLAFIDSPTPLKHGVGEARKIGMDSAIKLMTDAQNAEQSILVSLDADTIVDDDYFVKISQSFETHQDFGGIAFDILHQKSENLAQEQAIRAYERYLEAYYQTLKYANSPFAYKSIGSAFACRVSTYMQAGGMRKVKAGEDFYFLEALAKVHKVYFDRIIVVHPSARLSDRVVFGTGVAIKEIINGKVYGEFGETARNELKKLLNSATQENLKDAEKFIQLQSIPTQKFFEELNFVGKWQKVIQHTQVNKLAYQFRFNFFDALKTLQFLKIWK